MLPKTGTPPTTPSPTATPGANADSGGNNTRYIAHCTLTFGNIQHNAPTVGITSNASTQHNTYDTLGII